MGRSAQAMLARKGRQALLHLLDDNCSTSELMRRPGTSSVQGNLNRAMNDLGRISVFGLEERQGSARCPVGLKNPQGCPGFVHTSPEFRPEIDGRIQGNGSPRPLVEGDRTKTVRVQALDQNRLGRTGERCFHCQRPLLDRLSMPHQQAERLHNNDGRQGSDIGSGVRYGVERTCYDRAACAASIMAVEYR